MDLSPRHYAAQAAWYFIGQYVHNQIYTDRLPMGGAQFDTTCMSIWLQEAGYRTAYLENT